MGNIAGNQRYQDGGTLPGADFIYPIQKNLPNPPMKEVRLTVPKGHPANKPLEILDPVNKYKLLVGVNSAQSPPGSEIITQIPALECMITSTLTTAPPGCAVEMQRPVVFEMVRRGRGAACSRSFHVWDDWSRLLWSIDLLRTVSCGYV